MATLQSLITLVAVLFCIGQNHISADVSLADMKARLSSLEARQQTMQDSLGSVEQVHARDMNNVTQFCQGIEDRVEEQKELLEYIQESLEDKEEEENDRHGPCDPSNYKVIDDARREPGEVYSGDDRLCDDEIQPGWYRFLLHGENAIIPTTCVPEYQCQTHAPTWIDLQGQSLPPVGQHVEGLACSHWSEQCCLWEVPITVHNCGDYLVYNLRSLRYCSLAYCAELED